MESSYLSHYGIKGMKWGIRRYQYADGTLTPAGKRRYSNAEYTLQDKIENVLYKDVVLSRKKELSRVQISSELLNQPFYATYKSNDVKKYIGLFGNNLKTRAEYDATKAEKKAKKTGNDIDIEDAKNKREYSDSLKVNQVKIALNKNIKVPSSKNATDIMLRLAQKDSNFKDDMEWSIKDASTKMKRPSQQIVFNKAKKALRNDISDLTASDRKSLYNAYNMSLTFHDERNNSSQKAFYSELKKKGYSAIVDVNDKKYSSYHAENPLIVFDTNNVKLKSVEEIDQKLAKKYNRVYNADRIIKDIPSTAVTFVMNLSMNTYSHADDYVGKYSK